MNGRMCHFDLGGKIVRTAFNGNIHDSIVVCIAIIKKLSIRNSFI